MVQTITLITNVVHRLENCEPKSPRAKSERIHNIINNVENYSFFILIIFMNYYVLTQKNFDNQKL